MATPPAASHGISSGTVVKQPQQTAYRRPIVIAGPSGSGKSTVTSRLIKEYPNECARAAIPSGVLSACERWSDWTEKIISDCFEWRSSSGAHWRAVRARFGFSVSHTTRAPRPGEVDGVHYHFTTRDAMKKEIEEGKFIEHAEVCLSLQRFASAVFFAKWTHSGAVRERQFAGNMYGTSRQAVEVVQKAGRTCLLDIDVQGCESVKRTSLNARFLFVAPPSLEVLEKRLRGRGDTSEDAVRRRMDRARVEMSYMDRPGFFERVIVNDDLERAYAEFREYCRDASSKM
jgi:guanylate kinase